MEQMVIVISGADGAGGGVVLPAVAERLGVPVQARSAPNTVPFSGPDALTESDYQEKSEAEIRGMLSTGGVIRDGAAVVVLPEDAVTLRVRLGGPLDGRVRQTMAHTSDQDEATVRAELERSDVAWGAYYRRAYGLDATEAEHYHIVLDSTALEWALCIDIIESAARSRAAIQRGQSIKA